MKNQFTYGLLQSMKIRLILLICSLSGATWAQTQSNFNGLITDVRNNQDRTNRSI